MKQSHALGAFEEDAVEQLARLESAARLRTPPVVEPLGQGRALVDGRNMLLLCSNDYLGLADVPARAASGTGAGASRLVSGTRSSHRDAERSLAELVGADDAVLFSSGYALNVSVPSVFAGPGDLLLSDALNHASLIDGCRLSRAEVRVYDHCDVEHARRLASDRGAFGRVLIVTDAVFSMDGDDAPLNALSELANDLMGGLYVDDAHGIGVFGQGGAGTCADRRVVPNLLVGTLGKAFGLSGAFVAGSLAATAIIRQRARGYVFSTAPSPALADAIVERTAIVREADSLRMRVLAHAERLRNGLRELGYVVSLGRGPIVPVIVGEERDALRLSARLLEGGVFVQAIRPPTVAPGTSRLRVVPSAAHTAEQIDFALNAFADALDG